MYRIFLFPFSILLTQAIWAGEFFLKEHVDLPQNADIDFIPIATNLPFSETNSSNLRHYDLNETLLKNEAHYGIELRFSEIVSNQILSFKSQSIQFVLNEIPLCELQIKSHTRRDARYLIGKKPPEFSTPNKNWPNLSKSQYTFKEKLREGGISSEILVEESKKCYVLRNHEAFPTWSLIASSKGLKYRGLADEIYTYLLEPLFFHSSTNATAKIYPNNPLDDQTEIYHLKNMNDHRRLENSFFYTTVDSSSTHQNAISSDGFFSFETSSSEFAQTSIFTNANRTYDWFKSLGWENHSNEAIRLVAHAVVRGGINNALYQPSQNGSGTIFIGDGDGITLRNLATDADVVSHEFSHHVVYANISSVKGESLVLHEGIADFFTFIRTKNSCLGESICPPGSSLCMIDGKCLRTAKNSLKFGDDDLPTEEHLRSQFISGMLWDLVEIDKIDPTLLAKLTLGAVQLLVHDSGYQDFILALLLADQDLSVGKNCQKIFDRAESRGLSKFIESFSCSDNLPSIGSQAKASTEEVNVSKGEKICGAIQSFDHPLSSVFFLLLPLLNPIYKVSWNIKESLKC